MSSIEPSTGVAAGVPFVALPPGGDPAAAPVVVAWHGTDPPGSARSMAAALPLGRLNAWRIFLDLPGHGGRPAGEPGPVVKGAADELPDVLAELGTWLPLGAAPIGLLGDGTGAAVTQLVLAESVLPVRAAAFIDPVGPIVVSRTVREPRPWRALIVVTGDADDAAPEQLWYALNTGGSVRASLVTLPAADPGRVDGVVTDWFRRNLRV